MSERGFALLCARLTTRRGPTWRTLIVGVIAAVAAAGCTTTGGRLAPDTPAAVKQEAVGKRAAERWQAVIRGDYQAAYEYFSAASREVIGAGGFAARMSKFTYRSAAADKVECEGEICTVRLTLTYDFPQMRMTNVPTPVQENWIIERGQAWLVFRE